MIARLCHREFANRFGGRGDLILYKNEIASPSLMLVIAMTTGDRIKEEGNDA